MGGWAVKDYKSENYIDKSAWGDGVWVHEDDKATWRDDLSDYPCGIERDEKTGALAGWFGVEEGEGAYGKQADSFPIVWPAQNVKAYKADDGVWRFEQLFDQGRPATNWMPERYRDWIYVQQAVTDGARALYAVGHPEIPDTPPAGPPRNPPDTGGDTPTTPPPSDGPAPQNPGTGDSNPTPDNPVGTPESGDQSDTQPAPPQPVPVDPHPVPGQPPEERPPQQPPVSPTPVPGEPPPENPPDTQPPAGEGGPQGNPDSQQPGAPDRTDGGTAGEVT
jgi:hypothetical protein